MAKSYNRSFRRSHKERMKAKARAIYPHNDEAYKLADNLAFCSCPACGNPRRSGWCKSSYTRQEYEAELNLHEELNEEGILIPKAKKRIKRFGR